MAAIVKVPGPLFKCFGSKWGISKKLPPPPGKLIVEPYAVGALRERYGTFQSSMALFICATVLGAAVAALVHARSSSHS